jgi:hypothetical protein
MKHWAISVKAWKTNSNQLSILQRRMSIRKYSAQEKQVIIQMYNEGYNTVSISKKIGRCQSGVERFLKRECLYDGVRNIEISKEDIKNIGFRYQNGETAKEILVDYYPNIKSENTIISIVQQCNQFPRRRGARSTIKNHHYFEIIDTPEKAYWLGFWIADGSVSMPKRKSRSATLALSLKREDRYLLELFKQAVDGKFAITPTRSCFKIGFSSDKMATDLAKYNVVPNKSKLNLGLPAIPFNLVPHLIRGIFDGDGTVYLTSNYLRFGFYGANLLCNDIKDYLSKHHNLNNNKVFNKGTVSMVYYGSQKDICTFYNLIYTDASIFMKRKRQKFDYYLANTEITTMGKNIVVS